MSNEITGELEEFELFAQQLAQMAQEGTMPKPETELNQELPPYKVSPQEVTQQVDKRNQCYQKIAMIFI